MQLSYIPRFNNIGLLNSKTNKRGLKGQPIYNILDIFMSKMHPLANLIILDLNILKITKL